MKKTLASLAFAITIFVFNPFCAWSQKATNPIIFADVPDLSMVRVGDTYYMSSTTMHMSPGVPIMKSKDLVNWQIVSYAYDVLDDVDALNLNNGKSTYGAGSWASSIRYHNGTFYVSTFAGTTRKTYIYSTKNIEKGPWKKISFQPMMHDHSLFFDDDGRVYMLYGAGKIMMAELSEDLSGIKPGTTPQVVIENASAPGGPKMGLQAEGSQLFKVNGKYYLFNICWPRGGMRTVTIHRADKIGGPYEGRLALQDKGVAQGGLISTPKGEWYAYLFRDYGSVGRIPYWVPVKWEDGWPVLGIDGKVPDTLNLPASKGWMPGIVASDEFGPSPNPSPVGKGVRGRDVKKAMRTSPALPLVWQWNHNPDNAHWSLTARPGYLRLTTSRVDTSLLLVKNMLTQRTFGPTSAGSTAIDVSNMKDGDCAGLALLQKKFGWVGVRAENGSKSIVMVSAEKGKPEELQRVPLNQSTVYLKAECDFLDMTDKGYFYYSLDGKTWTKIGGVLQMEYTLPHFMGYRFGLFNWATGNPGGYVDFDYLRLSDKIAVNK